MSQAHIKPESELTGSWLVIIGAAGLGIGGTGLAMVLTSRAVSLPWYGAFLWLVGLAQLFELVRHLSTAGRVIRGVLALLYLGSGAVLMSGLAETWSLKLPIAILLFAAGASRVVWSLAWPKASKVWGALAGALTTSFGLLLLAGWPTSSVWLLGAVVAADLMVYGASAVVLGRTLQRSGR